MIENGDDTDFLQWLEKDGCPRARTGFEVSYDRIKASGLTSDKVNHQYTECIHSTRYGPPPPGTTPHR
ncbi:MAG: hypothetical protein COT71_03545 [Candidatus Andersenbacteria bacterium CG10_big_fil_rev_8_21_14_0_10_54_11]|uniref:Uncharacterized protein n=1 Tax=Candidatus Andersenbacteria bacterium CG10_big_fil_rev_8_21_14_0_10_54_11 TaxID=1974485 RepID=A0A2M6WYP0_9BACT|nr:MAG: hypothetical protein COT71_03545 [Candidatus Andersenbacteria bacterium CG10_big_fil_rev_8_21_14_0_10_54_11]